jgi:hypothetical protein
MNRATGAPRSPFVLGLSLVAGLLLHLPTTVGAQEPTKPPFSFPFEVKAGERLDTVLKPDGVQTLVITGGVNLVAKDLQIVADRVEWDASQQRVVATGNVRITRGDETIQAASFVFEGVEGFFVANEALALSPPFRITGKRITQTPEELRAEDARLALRPDGGGELRFRTDELRIRQGNRLILRNPTIYLFGTRLLTVRYLSLPLSDSSQQERTAGATPPLTFRLSPASGTAIGIGKDVALSRNVFATAQADATTRQGVQYTLGLRANFLHPPPDLRARRALPLPGGIPDPDATPLQRILTARRPPPPFDPVLDYYDVLSTPNLLAQPTRFGTRLGFVRAVYTHNREFGGRRQGIVLVSRKPELEAFLRLPLTRPMRADDNAEARRALRSPRLVLLGEAATGTIKETRLNETRRRSIEQDRTAGLIGIGLQPLLVGPGLLVGGQVFYQHSRYHDGQTYRIAETSLAAALPWRTGSVGAALIKRGVGGATPFIYDSVDTQNEAQARGEIRLNRITLAGLVRYDTDQNRLFDTEIAVGLRGSLFEPRFSYRTLNGGQFSFNIGVVGLSAF